MCVRRRQWHPTPVLLPGKSHGWRSLVGCSPWGPSELDKTKQLHFHFSLSCIGEGNGNPLQCSCLKNPRDRAWWAAVYGVAQSWTWWSDLAAAAAAAGLRLTGRNWLYFFFFHRNTILFPYLITPGTASLLVTMGLYRLKTSARAIEDGNPAFWAAGGVTTFVWRIPYPVAIRALETHHSTHWRELPMVQQLSFKSLFPQTLVFCQKTVHKKMEGWNKQRCISEVTQSCPTLCDPMDCSLPGSSVHGIFQARVLEWVAISSSRGSSQPRDRTWVSCIVGRRFTIWATREVERMEGWNKQRCINT